MIHADDLHRAADVVAERGDEVGLGVDAHAFDEFFDTATFTAEIGGLPMAIRDTFPEPGTYDIHRGSMMLGIAIGIAAGRADA